MRLAPEPGFAYRAGLRFHPSTYGMYGFAILSSTNFRQTMRFAERYHQLATPLAAISFKEEGECGEWTIAPLPHPDIDAALYRFLVEHQFGIHASLHRDVMGLSFRPRELKVVYRQTEASSGLLETCGCPVAFGQPENEFIFDAAWLERGPTLGNDLTYLSVVDLCGQLIEEFQLRAGVAGKVREALLINLARPMSFNAVAKHMRMSTRTLRRRLTAEGILLPQAPGRGQSAGRDQVSPRYEPDRRGDSIRARLQRGGQFSAGVSSMDRKRAE